jgi:hypothetical protein
LKKAVEADEESYQAAKLHQKTRLPFLRPILPRQKVDEAQISPEEWSFQIGMGGGEPGITNSCPQDEGEKRESKRVPGTLPSFSQKGIKGPEEKQEEEQ